MDTRYLSDNPQFEEATEKLNHLSSIRERFLIRAELLPADLALVGLYNELRDAAFLAFELCHLHAQPAAFPLARTVFEATQQIIVLATEDNYLGVGTRAWLYHLRKERRIAQLARGAEAAHDWFQQQVLEIQRIWAAYNPSAEKILRDENAQLDAFEFAHPAWPHLAHLDWPHLMLIFCLRVTLKSSKSFLPTVDR